MLSIGRSSEASAAGLAAFERGPTEGRCIVREAV
jgi:hypothetical protein